MTGPSLSSRTTAMRERCPNCQALPGQPCVGARNKVRLSCHRERHEIPPIIACWTRSKKASGADKMIPE